MANRHTMSAIILAVAVLPACDTAPAERTWLDGGEYLHDAVMSEWAQAPPRDQLSVAAYFLWSVRRQDDGFSMADPGFMTEAAALRECMVKAWQGSSDIINPDTPARDHATLCQVVMASQ